MIEVTAEIELDEGELKERFIRSSGPGGQNVNKVATAVQLRFNVAKSKSLPADVRHRLLARGDRRMTVAGELVIEARRHRTLERNREDALQRLLELLREAAVPPLPRKKTRPSMNQKRQRLELKRHRTTTKQRRQKPNPFDH